jgi:hypothetical protein
MANVRNAFTTHPRKKARRARAMERFTVCKLRMSQAPYMAAKLREFIALGGVSEDFASVTVRAPQQTRVVAVA